MTKSKRTLITREDFAQLSEEIYDNTSENKIHINESKAINIYNEFIKDNKHENVLTYLGLALAFFTPIFTSDFKQVWFLTGDTFKTSFMLFSVYFFKKAIQTLFVNKKNKDKYSQEAFISALKGEKDNKQTYAVYRAYLEGYKDKKNNKKCNPFRLSKK